MPLNITTTRDRLQKFEFTRLFIDELGWSNPKSRNPVKAQVKEFAYTRTPIAQLAGVVVFQVTTGDGIPDAKTRAAIQKHVAEEHVENLLIFLERVRKIIFVDVWQGGRASGQTWRGTTALRNARP